MYRSLRSASVAQGKKRIKNENADQLLSSIVVFDFRRSAKVLRQFDWCCRPCLLLPTPTPAPLAPGFLKSLVNLKKNGWFVLSSLRLVSLHYYGNQ